MTICYFCGTESSELEECNLCKQKYCPNHLEPHSHDCPLSPIINPYDIKMGPGNQLVTPEELASEPFPQLNQSQQPQTSHIQYPAQYNYSTSNANIINSNTHNTLSTQSIEDYVYTDGSFIWHKKDKTDEPIDAFDPKSGVVIPGILWPEKSELYHVIFASILLLALVCSNIITNFVLYILNVITQAHPTPEILNIYIQLYLDGFLRKDLVNTPILALFFLAAFLVHEFSHRQTAKKFKLQTKFRLFKKGVIMSLICLVLPLKFALPGAVVVIGLENIGRETGLCKLAGPLSNLIFGAILLVFGAIFSNYWLISGATFNFFLGTFNMLPFGILDGDNIRKWKPKLWLIVFVVLLAFAIISFMIQNKLMAQL